jgi:predicted dehydrogenase
VHENVEAMLADPGVDAIYIATPPCRITVWRWPRRLRARAVWSRKPMAMSHAESIAMVAAFEKTRQPLWVAFYRRALPRFLEMRRLLHDGAIGQLTSIHIWGTAPLPTPQSPAGWRIDPAVAGAGLLFDLASHGFDLVDFLAGPVTSISGTSANTGGAYAAEDVTVASFRAGEATLGTSVWNFNASAKADGITLVGSRGTLRTSIFADADLVLTTPARTEMFQIRNPPHVHQPLVQTIVDELAGTGRCESTGVSATRHPGSARRLRAELLRAAPLRRCR